MGAPSPSTLPQGSSTLRALDLSAHVQMSPGSPCCQTRHAVNLGFLVRRVGLMTATTSGEDGEDHITHFKDLEQGMVHINAKGN